MLTARTTQFATWTLLLAIPAAALMTYLRLAGFDQTRDVLPVFFAESLAGATLASAGVLVLWLVGFSLTRRRFSAVASARIAAVLVFGPCLLLALHRINEALLPGFFDAPSMLWNAGLVPACLVLLCALSTALRRWQEQAWVSGKPRLLSLAVLLLVPVGAYFAGPGHARDPEPDVLVILLDVLRADRLGCYGYERATSPNIDALAQDGVLFENVVAASTYTKTSVASIFTGLNAHHHGVFTGTHGGGRGEIESDLLSERFTTLAEALYEGGLNTSAWVQNGHVRDYLGYAQGFTFYADQPGDVEVITEQYLDWKDAWGDVARTFTYLHVIDIHGPYDPQPPFLGKFRAVPPNPLASLSTSDTDAWSAFKARVRAGEQVLSAGDLEQLQDRYDELIAYVDHWVGRIIDDLKATGRYDNTLIMVLSDHGEAFWEHGFIGHSWVPFEEVNHVPMIIKMPGSRGAGRRVDRMLGHVDIVPTLLEFAEAPVPPGLDGESFLPLLLEADADIEPRTRFIEYYGMVGVRTERWKYLSLPGTEPRLFDLSVDPEELDDCIAAPPELAAQLQAAIDYARAERKKGKAERVVLDEDTVDSLRALGYL